MNLLEKQLSTVYFKDVRFPWVTLYKEGHVSNTSIDHNIIREQALQITAHFGVNKCTGSDGWIHRFKR